MNKSVNGRVVAGILLAGKNPPVSSAQVVSRPFVNQERSGTRIITNTKMAVAVCCTSLAFFLPVFLCFLYRKFRLPKLKGDLAKSFLRKDTSDKPAIIAHRGGSSEAPENTLAAFRTAKENGAYGVEFDVDFTKDGRPVVIHDSTVDRTTDGSGPVSEFTLEEIRKLDASAKHCLR